MTEPIKPCPSCGEHPPPSEVRDGLRWKYPGPRLRWRYEGHGECCGRKLHVAVGCSCGWQGPLSRGSRWEDPALEAGAVSGWNWRSEPKPVRQAKPDDTHSEALGIGSENHMKKSIAEAWEL
jgi:hypothetical protein